MEPWVLQGEWALVTLVEPSLKTRAESFLPHLGTHTHSPAAPTCSHPAHSFLPGLPTRSPVPAPAPPLTTPLRPAPPRPGAPRPSPRANPATPADLQASPLPFVLTGLAKKKTSKGEVLRTYRTFHLALLLEISVGWGRTPESIVLTFSVLDWFCAPYASC